MQIKKYTDELKTLYDIIDISNTGFLILDKKNKYIYNSLSSSPIEDNILVVINDRGKINPLKKWVIDYFFETIDLFCIKNEINY